MEQNRAEFTEASMAIAAQPGLLIRTIGIAFAAHLVNLTTLYFLFLAFHQKVHFGVLVAGYAMGILFWIIVHHTPGNWGGGGHDDPGICLAGCAD